VSQKNEIGFWKPVKNCIFWYVNENKQRCRGSESVQNKCAPPPSFLIKDHYFIFFWNLFLILTWLIIIKIEIPYRGVSTKEERGPWRPLLPENLQFFLKNLKFFVKTLQFFSIVRDHAPRAPPASSTSLCPWFHVIFVFSARNWVFLLQNMWKGRLLVWPLLSRKYF
jgi:hypothetical protein